MRSFLLLQLIYALLTFLRLSSLLLGFLPFSKLLYVKGVFGLVLLFCFCFLLFLSFSDFSSLFLSLFILDLHLGQILSCCLFWVLFFFLFWALLSFSVQPFLHLGFLLPHFTYSFFFLLFSSQFQALFCF